MSAAILEKARELMIELTADEKLQLMEELNIQTSESDFEISPAWIEKIQQSEADMLSGKDPGVPWEILKGEMRALRKAI